MKQIQSQKQTDTYLKALENNLQISLFDLSSEKASKFQNFIKDLSHDEGFGVLLRNDVTPSIIKKTLSLFLTSLRIWWLSYKFKRHNSVVGRFCVYPSIEEPVAIFELGTPAEQYINQFVLPAFPPGFNGKLRKIIMVLVQCHPSSAGIILVARKK